VIRAPKSRLKPDDGWVVRAERILAELDLDTKRALSALARQDADAVVEAVEARGRAMGELDEVVANLARARMRTPAIANEAVVRRLATAAEKAVEAHHDLVERVTVERTKLANAVATMDRHDRVADHYAPRSAPAHTLSLSA
jgi:hypothetical protein